MSRTVFLLGAGFNADAAIEAGPKVKAKYPLVGDLLYECFGQTELPSGMSIEDLFQRSIENKDPKPVQRLTDLLMKADLCVAPLLYQGDRNAYREFLEAFPTEPILTFNYDGLPEILALHLGQWRPDDGFGPPVHALCPKSTQGIPRESRRQILHLHGSVYVYSIDVEILPGGTGPGLMQRRSSPKYNFDAHTAADVFRPFEGEFESPYFYPHERFIAPVPRKAAGLREAFVSGVHRRAITLLGDTSELTVIGYSFNPFDQESYSSLLRAMTGCTVTLVLPGARGVVRRLAAEYPNINWQPIASTFRDWVGSTLGASTAKPEV